MLCFYHSSDLDGHCSGAIVKCVYPECEMIGINYGQEFPWHRISQNDVVFMVDFTLQPFDKMGELASKCNLTWLDHHKTEVEEAERRGFKPDGVRKIGEASCSLTWKYLFNCNQTPLSVQLLAAHDVWDHTDPRTLPFQYGFRMFNDTSPENQELWIRFFESRQEVGEVIKIGNVIIEYEKNQNAKFCKAYVFSTAISADIDGEKHTYRAIACNRGFTNSKIFDSVWDEKMHDVMITFVRLKLPAKKWTVSLYSTKPDVDCGKIARFYGGGGHPGAAGFQCDELPFNF